MQDICADSLVPLFCNKFAWFWKQVVQDICADSRAQLFCNKFVCVASSLRAADNIAASSVYRPAPALGGARAFHVFHVQMSRHVLLCTVTELYGFCSAS